MLVIILVNIDQSQSEGSTSGGMARTHSTLRFANPESSRQSAAVAHLTLSSYIGEAAFQGELEEAIGGKENSA